MFWFRPPSGGSVSSTELYCYDLPEKSHYTYKPVGFDGSLVLEEDEFGPVIEELHKMKQNDSNLDYVDSVALSSILV